jgi:hypothetical protein
MRPQVGVLVTPEQLIGRRQVVGSRELVGPRQVIDSRQVVGSRQVTGSRRPVGRGADEKPPVGQATLGAAPPWLEWIGEVAAPVAQRIACDADVWRVVLDPATGRPTNVGRAYRLVPAWIRRALHARDRGCRFPGCRAPAPWTDAHHVRPWAHAGRTDIDNLILLCRFHHGLVHEGRWTIRLDTDTGEISAGRPDGRPYEIRDHRTGVSSDRVA